MSSLPHINYGWEIIAFLSNFLFINSYVMAAICARDPLMIKVRYFSDEFQMECETFWFGKATESDMRVLQAGFIMSVTPYWNGVIADAILWLFIFRIFLVWPFRSK